MSKSNITPKNIKLLWGLAGGTCSFREKLRRCKTQLVKNIITTSTPTVTGQMAHEPPAERIINRELSDEELNSYDNLILLCHDHHKYVDEHPDIYTNLKLKKMKERHEYWVSITNKRDYNPVVQHRIKFYNIFLYSCTIYLAVAIYVSFISKEQGSFVFTYTILYLVIPFFVYTFDEKKLLDRVKEYKFPEKIKFRIKLFFFSFLTIIFIPIFAYFLWFEIYVDHNFYAIAELLGLPILMLIFLGSFKRGEKPRFLIRKFNYEPIE